MNAWPREVWAEAVWSSNLRPLQRLVALAYADHAKGRETAWVTYPRLMDRTGLSRDAVARHLRALVDAGWLVQVTPPRQHWTAVYRLTVPGQRSATAQPAEGAEPVNNPPSSTRDGLLSSTPDGLLSSPAVRPGGPSSTRDVPHQRTNHTSPPTPPTVPGPMGGQGDAEVRDLMAAHGLSAAVAAEVVERCTADTATISVSGRLRQSGYVSAVLDAIRADRERAARNAPRCEDHPHEIATSCSSCWGDVRAGERDPADVGRQRERTT